MKKKLHLIAVILPLLALTACGTSTSHKDGRAVTPTQGTFKVGNPYKIDGQQYIPQESYSHTETGIASWYGPGFHGKRTANGEAFDQNALTAAHRTLQMPSLVRVTNLENGRSIIVRINDRGPFSRGRVIDLSARSAELLQFKNQGTAKVKLQVLGEESRAIAEAAKRGVNVNGVEIAMNEGRGLDSRFLMHNTSTGGAPATTQTAQAYTPPASQNIVRTLPVTPTNIYIQAGSFSSPDNAYALASRLQGFGNAQVIPANVNGQAFHRVRLGPISNVTQADSLLTKLATNGYDKAITVVE